MKEIGPAALLMSERTLAIAERVRGRLVASLPVHPESGGIPAALRAQAGDVLAALGDPRFDPQRLYLPADELLGFVRIAADPGFRIGTRKADRKRVEKLIGTRIKDHEINDALTPSPEFHIARYAVTVAQFRAFVDATLSLGNPDALRDADNRPVRWVDWRESMAYCAWLNDMLTGSPVFAGHPIAMLVREYGWHVDLPDQLEWEKAARGDLDNAVYSWGDMPDPQRANIDRSGIDDTAAVGCFLANPFGLYDMLGNVWQWTRSVHRAYPPRALVPADEPVDPAKAARVVRGGSWRNSHDYARCACRSRAGPDIGNVNLGFRVVLRAGAVPER